MGQVFNEHMLSALQTKATRCAFPNNSKLNTEFDFIEILSTHNFSNKNKVSIVDGWIIVTLIMFMFSTNWTIRIHIIMFILVVIEKQCLYLFYSCSEIIWVVPIPEILS